MTESKQFWRLSLGFRNNERLLRRTERRRRASFSCEGVTEGYLREGVSSYRQRMESNGPAHMAKAVERWEALFKYLMNISYNLSATMSRA